MKNKEIEKCIICGKEIPERRIKQDKKTCCRSCEYTKRYRENPDNKLKRCLSQKKANSNPEVRHRKSLGMKKTLASQELIQKWSEASKLKWTNPKLKQKQSESQRKRFKNSEERQKMSEKLTQVYDNFELRQKQSDIQKQVWSNEKRLAQSEKLKQVYKNPELKQKMSNAQKEAQNKPKTKAKRAQSLKQVWSNENRRVIVLRKRYDTMKQNNSYAKSKSEDSTYELLLTKFNQDDIMFQYFDKQRYPFKSDFYIKSLDLFIECHYSEFHQYEPFDSSNKEHLKRLKELEQKAKEKFEQTGKKSRYHSMIYQWTDLDVRKVQCAKDNKLNWKVFYSLDQFKEWHNNIKDNNLDN